MTSSTKVRLGTALVVLSLISTAVTARDGTCYDVDPASEYRCCSHYPQLEQLVNCAGNICHPTYIQDQMTVPLKVVSPGWSLETFQGSNWQWKWCKIKPALCDYTKNPPECTVGVQEDNHCTNYTQPSGQRNCSGEIDP